MAGLTTSSTTTTFPFKSLPSSTTKPHSLSSLDFSKLFGLRLRGSSNNPNSSLSASHISITARYGGGGGSGSGSFPRSPPGDYRRSRQNKPSEEDQALDMSSIRAEMVRLIDGQQNMVGIVSKGEALRMAEDAELDLVILSPDADPPVVRMMDYNKYKYELQKKKRDQQKKSAANRMDLKELKMGYNIDVHDYTVRLKAAKKFLKDGDKVKVLVSLKGRQVDFRNNAIELVRRFQNDIGELATEESKSFRDRSISIVMVPNKLVVQKAPELPKKQEKETETEVSAGV